MKELIFGIENREKEGKGVARRLDADAGLAPVSPLGVVAVLLSVCCLCDIYGCEAVVASRGIVPDGVARPQADPLGDRAVLLLSFGKLLLGAEGLVALRNISIVFANTCVGGSIPAS